ncbi:Rrf2 family transcriptional regulator [Amphiplicatus metriothermophilus]|uniref:Transcriptional regulator, BadM/Rrf2 family n=1 Tax=Amphiplicatus metriothermophilus TaxID=1519374 RepID=A0A239PJW4_9PROT|nr:Rrf2 family transcriptional regulator [Amphiplicatus metriothermophilus]MBB5517569.1 Rrf2 family protein [Amphiplicatus metriothermophilus]SNT68096.1 transcriptional regulator, BadM/Rrf2 family [Amphiplicatus metriothermophilus]
MAFSTRFATATHLLAVLALSRPAPVTSETLAASAGTNPVVARRLIGRLVRAGLVRTQGGKGGGATLARPPKKITLRAVFEAVEHPLSLAPENPGRREDGVGAALPGALARPSERAARAFAEALDQTTLKGVVKALKNARDRRKAA